MRGMTEHLTIGERVAWYRRRRGLSQQVLAGLVGRTADWLSKAENNRIELDRLSVVTALAEALGVSLGDLLAEPTLMEGTDNSGYRGASALCEVLMDYTWFTSLPAPLHHDDEPPALQDLRADVEGVLDAYQTSRYGFATRRLPLLLAEGLAASRAYSGDDQEEAHALLALAYQGAAMVLGKVGEPELAWMAADRGLAAAQHSGRSAVTGSLVRAVTHCLLSTGRFGAAVELVNHAAAAMQPELSDADDTYLSVYGTLFLAGAMAAARAGDRQSTRTFLHEADEAAQRLGADANHLWTAFGPTNVSVHRAAAAGELGDIQIATDLGMRIDTSGMPVERRVRHGLEVARSLSAWNRTDEAVAVLLEAERNAPEQVRHHRLSQELVIGWIRGTRGRPSRRLADLARRLRIVSSG